MNNSLPQYLEKLKGKRILCAGDIMLDRFVYGQVERISPEAPIPVLRVGRENAALGGSGNVARNIVALGGQVDMVGVVGKDQAGYEIAGQISDLLQVTSYLLTDASRPTTVKTRFVAEGQQLLRSDFETSSPISPETEKQILNRISSALESCDAVILSDYAKGALTESVVAETIKAASEKGVKTFIDPKGRDFGKYRGAFMLTPNRKELSESTGIKISSISDAENAARKLISENGVQGILAKLGGDGVCLIMKDSPSRHFKTHAREVYDVSGAGDTVVAAMALAFAGGVPVEESAMLANLAGSIVVGKIGTAVATQEDIAREISRAGADESEKIMSIAAAAEAAERWRKQGMKVGFTNGVFDLLHPGHLSLIRQARAACDRLVVGINSDASVKRLKGESRPVQNEGARAAVMASLADVDAVAIFAEDTPIELIKAIRPQILVKGADYKIEQVVGGDLVAGWGGKVLLAELVTGQSTTATIAKLQNDKAAK